MSPTLQLRGMTWAHRRAVDPLIATLPAFAAEQPVIAITWDARPLSGFEFTPVATLAERYDLIILDHPFCGDIAADRALLPLEDLVAAEGIESAFVGPSLATYRYAGHVWALPVDAACQVAVCRADLMQALGAAVPRTWEEVLALGAHAARRGWKLAIALAGVHALMTFFTLCANQGRPCATDPSLPLVEADAAAASLEAMRRLLACCPPEVLDWNSIALHEAMVARDDLVYCPAVYCYAAYAEADMRRPLRFADLPGLAAPTPRGSAIGGAGIGVSARTAQPEAALAYVRFLMRSGTQRAFADHHGQPARRSAWDDPAIDARFGGCFSATRATMEHCWIRPRYAGYLAFQKQAGDLVEAHLRGVIGEADLLARLEHLHRTAGAG
jgi:multiple sugar transport system substrate-binding protein